MLLAEKKKQENISEYIIYMYQTELLIRSFELDIDKVESDVIQKIPIETLPISERGELRNWYQEIIVQMNEENLQNEGHLSSVQDIVKQLSDLSLSLQVESQDYRNIFNSARPYIRASIQASEGLINDPIQACLNGIFGFLIIRMKDQELDEDTQIAVENFGNVLSVLSHHYGNTK